jgi:PAS domain S-box-containing protein
MEDLWVHLADWKVRLAAIAGILGSLVVIWKYLSGPFRCVWENLKFMYNAKQTQEHITEKLDTIMLQLVPNGGTSIRDSLDRIEDKQHFFGSFLKTQLNTHAKGMFETNAAGQWTWVNRPHSRLTGFQPGEVMGDGWINVVAPECRSRVEAKWEAAIEAGREFDENVWYIKTDKTTRYLVNVHAYIIENRDNSVGGYIGEVTLLEETQQEPISSEQRRNMDRPIV